MRSLALAAVLSLPLAGAARAAPAGPFTCAAVGQAFAAGAYDRREAIVDALQAHLKAAHALKPLGRDGRVQAVLLAVTRCDALGHGDFMAALDASTAQVEREKVQFGDTH